MIEINVLIKAFYWLMNFVKNGTESLMGKDAWNMLKISKSLAIKRFCFQNYRRPRCILDLLLETKFQS